MKYTTSIQRHLFIIIGLALLVPTSIVFASHESQKNFSYDAENGDMKIIRSMALAIPVSNKKTYYSAEEIKTKILSLPDTIFRATYSPYPDEISRSWTQITCLLGKIYDAENSNKEEEAEECGDCADASEDNSVNESPLSQLSRSLSESPSDSLFDPQHRLKELRRIADVLYDLAKVQ